MCLIRRTFVATLAGDRPVISAIDAASSCSRYSSMTCRSSGFSRVIKPCSRSRARRRSRASSLVVTATDEPDCRVRFEFAGGCRDGEVYEGPLANPFFWKSEHGKLGARFLVPSPASVEAMLKGESTGPILDQEYEVVENRLQDGTRYFRAEARQGDRRKR